MTQNLIFPSDFTFGAATAAFQIEGATAEDGRGPSIWDTLCQRPQHILDGSDGSVACDHYHRMEEDVEMMRSLNLETYRFSISWSRIFPDGKTFNPAGADFYSRLVDRLLEAGIDPWVTLYHWDLPQALEDLGGWANRDTAYRFSEYARAMHDRLGSRVSTWTTLNEPWCSAFLGYASGEHAPGRQDPHAAVTAVHHLLLAHGLALRTLRDADGDAILGITLNPTVAHPANPNRPQDVEAARRVDGATSRIFLDPIFKGHYPEDVLEDMSEAGLGKAVRDGDMELISAPIDVLGVNFYHGGAHTLADCAATHIKLPNGDEALNPLVGSENVVPVDRGLPHTGMGWEVKADDLRILLLRLHQDYTGPAEVPMVVTENGAAYEDNPDEFGFVDDSAGRQAYIRDHLIAIHQAIAEGVRMKGYLVWSLLDNFEWAWGYTQRFGIVRVDYETLRRIPKASARWYSQVAQTHQIELAN